MLKERNAKLEEADLHRFLKDLDHFQAWMSTIKSNIANEDSPSSLAEAEKLYPHIGKSVKKFTAMLMTTVP